MTMRHIKQPHARDIPALEFWCAIFLMACWAAGLVHAGQASAHPYDAPQLGDISELAYTPANCEASFTSVTARNTSDRTAEFELQRKIDGEWQLATEGNDGVLSYISGVRYAHRAVVTVAPGELFEINGYQWPGDSGEYRLISRWPGGAEDTYGPLAGWVSENPNNCS